MNSILWAAAPAAWIICIPLLFFIALYVAYRSPWFTFRTGFSHVYASKKSLSALLPLRIMYWIRFLLSGLLAFLIAQPKLSSTRQHLKIEGVPIMVVLDVSLSMTYFDDLEDRQIRIDAARAQARRFIKRRINDPIGIVLFAQGAVTRCPLTADKKILDSLLAEVKIGDIDPQGTKLSLGILMAAQRLIESNAPSKIIILLTDGAPTPDDISPDPVIDILKTHKIKVYTIGFGNTKTGGFAAHPVWGLQAIPSIIDSELLEKYAVTTGGKTFHAERPAELATIYDTIDTLERTDFDTPLYEQWSDIGNMLLLPLLFLFFIDAGLRLYWSVI